MEGARSPTGTYVVDARSPGQAVVNLTQHIVSKAPGLTGDCIRTGSKPYPIAALPRGPISLGTLTVNGYADYGIDVNASILDLVIDTTTMVCTFTDATGSHTDPPVPAGPEGGILKIAERSVVIKGKISGGNEDAPTVTPVANGTDTFTYGYTFTESR